MRRERASLVALGTLLSTTAAGALCTLPSIFIETTTEGIINVSGCYRESVYSGLYETTVWTIEGRDVAATGTKAILADLVSFILLLRARRAVRGR